MARKKTPKPATSKWAFRVAAAGIFLAEVAVMRGAASPFRLPKDAIALAAICLAVGFAVFEAARQKTFSFPRGRLSAVLLALPLLLVVSALWSASPLRALESAAFSLIWVFGILWLSTLESRTRLRLATVAAVGVAISATVMVFQIFGVQVFNVDNVYSVGRLSLTGLTGNPADIAMAAVLLLPLLLVKRDWAPTSRVRFALVLGLSLAALLTRTLSGVGALAVLLVAWLVQQRSRALWTRAAAIGGLFLAIALASGLGTRLTQGYERVQEGDCTASSLLAETVGARRRR